MTVSCLRRRCPLVDHIDIDIDEGAGVDSGSATGDAVEALRTTRRSPRQASTNRWMRLLHVYISMASMLLVAFFAITGLTLNHPEWALGSTSTTTRQGSVPAGAITTVGGTTNVDYLAIAEYARDAFGVSGHVKDYGLTGEDGNIDFAGPGYSANVHFSAATGALTATVTQNDFLAVMNDVHKGRDTDTSWKWVIDVSAIILLLVTVTGMVIQVTQRKRRQASLVTAAVCSVLAVVLIWVAVRSGLG